MEECANPILLGFVASWLQTARERNTKGVTVYKKAYDSLKACPLTLSHPSEAEQLSGFGPKLCERLTEEMKKHCLANNLPMPKRAKNQKKRLSDALAENDTEPVGVVKKARKAKPYVPALRSGAYAIILALATVPGGENAQSGLTKQQIVAQAQPYCDSSFSAPSDPGKFYTAWNSMTTLMGKNLVYEKGRPLRKYMLTDEGWEVAMRIKQASDPSLGLADTFSSRERVASEMPEQKDDEIEALDLSISELIPAGNSSPAIPEFTPITLKPGTFTVHLVLDVREVRAKQDRDYMQNELAGAGVTPIMRSLDLGDILWVAKVHDPNLLSRLGAEGDEIILDYVVERKRLDDLIGSIKDGRFHEQKFRLRKSGLKNVIYLVEEIAMQSGSFSKYEEAVQSAITSTQVVNGYFVKITQKMDDTIRYLARMTIMLKSIYEIKPLNLIPTNVLTAQNYIPLVESLRAKEPETDYHITYDAFASLASKSETLTLRDVYLKMLMCVKGLTGEKAIEIQRRWKTPKQFLEAFQSCGPGEQGTKKKQELVSSELDTLFGRKKITKALSIKISEVWGF